MSISDTVYSHKWNQHLNELVEPKISKQRLNELTEYPYRLIINWMQKAEPNDYAFADMFDNQWRVVVPYSTALEDLPNVDWHNRLFPRQIAIINGIARAGGFEISYKDDLVVRNYIKTFRGKEFPSTEKFTIGTYINRFLSFYEKMSAEEQDAMRSAVSKSVNYSGDALHYYDSDISYILKWWNDNNFRYIGEGDAANANRAIIVSRHPIDVVRMSDHRGFASCHSEDPDKWSDLASRYFYCAIQESQGHGPIAYLVKKSDLENIPDLQAGEIFKDDERGVRGIEPLQRLRIREIHNGKDHFSLMLPEQRAYGLENDNNFYPSVLKWIHSVQDPLLPAELKTPEPHIDLDDWEIQGGAYMDTSAGYPAWQTYKNPAWSAYFTRLFPGAKFTGVLSKADTDDLGFKDAAGRADDESSWPGNEPDLMEIDRAYVSRVIRRFNANSYMFEIDYDVDGDGDGNEIVMFFGNLKLSVSVDFLREHFNDHTLIFDSNVTAEWIKDMQEGDSPETFLKVLESPLRLKLDENNDYFKELNLNDADPDTAILNLKTPIDPDWLSRFVVYDDDQGGVDGLIDALTMQEEKYDRLLSEVAEYFMQNGLVIEQSLETDRLELQHFKTTTNLVGDDVPSRIYVAEAKLMPTEISMAMLPRKIVDLYLRGKKNFFLKRGMYDLVDKVTEESLDKKVINLSRLGEFMNVGVYNKWSSHDVTGEIQSAIQKGWEIDYPPELKIAYAQYPGDKNIYLRLSVRLTSRSKDDIIYLDENFEAIVDRALEAIYRSVMRDLVNKLRELIDRGEI